MQLQKISHIVGAGSGEICRCLDGSVGAFNTIDKTFDFLIQSSDRTFNVSRLIRKIIVRSSMITHMPLKEINLTILLDVLQNI